MKSVRTLFFGSAPDSLPVLSLLHDWSVPDFRTELVGVVTQPPRPVGRDKTVTPTPVQVWAEQHKLPVLSFASRPDTPWLFADETAVTDSIASLKPDLIIVTYYGQKIPWAVIAGAPYGGLNVHPSLLPRWRGADPIPWAILTGDHQVGVTVLTLAEQFDEGRIIGQRKIPLTDTDMAEAVYTRLFQLGAELLGSVLSDYLNGDLTGTPQGASPTPYARRLKREDGYIPWETLVGAITDGTEAEHVDRTVRALTPWPGVWTTVRINDQEKRLKILAAKLVHGRLDVETVQLEGKTAVPFTVFRQSYSGLR